VPAREEATNKTAAANGNEANFMAKRATEESPGTETVPTLLYMKFGDRRFRLHGMVRTFSAAL